MRTLAGCGQTVTIDSCNRRDQRVASAPPVAHGRYTPRRIAAKEDPYSVMEPTGKQPGTIAREDAGPARTSSARR